MPKGKSYGRASNPKLTPRKVVKSVGKALLDTTTAGAASGFTTLKQLMNPTPTPTPKRAGKLSAKKAATKTAKRAKK